MKRGFSWLTIVFLLALALQAGSAPSAAAPVRDPDSSDALQTAGSWRSGGPFTIDGQPAHTTAVAASPFYAQDGALFAAGYARPPYGSIFRTTNRGQSWSEVFYPTPPNPYSGGWFGQIAAVASGGSALTLFASYNGNLSPTAQAAAAPLAPYGTLYRSTDQGSTWAMALTRMQVGPFAVSPAFASDQTLFAMSEGVLQRSTDAGVTWQELPFPGGANEVDVFHLAVSPGYPSDHTLYAGGYGRTYRSTNGGLTWQALGGYNPTYGMALSPNFASDGTFWAAYRTIEGVGDGTPESGVLRYTNRGANWQLATVGLPGVFDPNPRHLAVSPAYASDGSLFTALNGPFAGWMQHGLFRTHNGGDSWIDLGSAPGDPNVLDLTATRTNAEGLVAHLATEAGVWHYGGLCEERLVNGGFELEAGWIFPDTPADAGYSLNPTHTGLRSLRAGIDTGADVFSYSSARQNVTLPAGLSAASLEVWWYPISQEGAAALAEPGSAVMAQVAAGEMPVEITESTATDVQYILLLDNQGNILKTLHWTRSNARAWQRLTFDLSAYIGRSFQIHFGVFNNGDGRRTAMFVDDASLVTCWPQPLTERVYLPMLLRQYRSLRPTATLTPTLAPTVTPTSTRPFSPTSTKTPTRAPTVTPTPTVAPSQTCYAGLKNGGFEQDGTWVIKSNPVPAAYVASPVHGGARAMRTGIKPGGANVESYSPIEQTVTLPAGLASAQLRLWRYRVRGDASAAAAPMLSDLPQTEAELPAFVHATDFFYVLAIRSDGSLRWLLVERTHDPAWREAVVDLGSLIGESFKLQFGTYNGGSGGISATYLDDISLTLCPPDGALVLDGWASRIIGRPDSATLYAQVGIVLYRSDDAGATWRVSGWASPDRPENTILGHSPSLLYASDGYPCYKGGASVSMWRSTDAGVSWQAGTGGSDLEPLAAHSTQPWVYAAGCNGPYRSSDAGLTFQHQPDPIFGLYDIHYLAPVGVDWGAVWAGSISEGGGGVVLVSRDAGENWTRSTPLEPELGWIGGMRASRFFPGYVYVSAVYGFNFTSSDGAAWLHNSEGLADVIDIEHRSDRPYGLFDVAEDPGRPQHQLFLGTIRGLYARDPVTMAWSKLTGKPYDAWKVSDLLVLDAAPQHLYVTTQYGVFVHDLAVAPPTPTPTPSPIPIGSIPSVIGTLLLPAGSHPHGLALNPDASRAYVGFHGSNHSGRTLALLSPSPLAVLGSISLAAGATGPNGVVWSSPGGHVLVANRQTEDVTVVQPLPGLIVNHVNADNMPNGVIVHGGVGYIANFGSSTVTVFDPTTFAVLRTLHDAGGEPSLFAVDATRDEVLLSAHGSNQIIRLCDGLVVGRIDGVTAPYGLSVDAAARRLYVANRGAVNTVSVFNADTGVLLRTFAIGREPYVLVVNPATHHLFVVCGNEVKVYDTQSFTHVTTLPVPPGAEEGIALDTLHNRVYITSGEGDAVVAIQDK